MNIWEIRKVFGFNPTLVRLRPGLEPGGWRRWGEFQSHAGSIEARAAAIARRALFGLVSIPRWFD